MSFWDSVYSELLFGGASALRTCLRKAAHLACVYVRYASKVGTSLLTALAFLQGSRCASFRQPGMARLFRT